MPQPSRHVTARISFRKGTTAEWLASDPVLMAAEPAVDTTENKLKIGNGTDKWSELSYVENFGTDLDASLSDYATKVSLQSTDDTLRSLIDLRATQVDLESTEDALTDLINLRATGSYQDFLNGYGSPVTNNSGGGTGGGGGTDVQPNCEQVALHLQPTAGETIADKSSNEHVITTVGDTAVDNTKTLFGGHTINFDGAGDYLSVGGTSTFKFLHDGTADYTVECWVNFSTTSSGVNPIIGTAGNSSTVGFSMYFTGGSNSEWRALIWNGNTSAARVDISDVPETNRWYHVAAVHANNTLYFYIDGVLGGSSSGVNYSTNSDSWKALRVGSAEASAGNNLYSDCQIQDIRISTKAVYTSNFTPPTNLLNNPCDGEP